MSDNGVRRNLPSLQKGVLSGVTCNYFSNLAHCSSADRASAIVNGVHLTAKCACYTASEPLDFTVQSNISNIASDDENAGEDFFDVAGGCAVLPDLPPPYESIHEISSSSNTTPPASNDVMLPNASVAAGSGRFTFAQPGTTGTSSNEDLLLEIRELAAAILTRS